MIQSFTLRGLLLWTWHRKEAFIWLGALLFLGMSNPGDHHYTLCPLSNMGFEFCPGCGLGRSIRFLLHGDIVSSFMSHPLGIPAFVLLIYRSVKLLAKKSSFEFTTI